MRGRNPIGFQESATSGVICGLGCVSGFLESHGIHRTAIANAVDQTQLFSAIRIRFAEFQLL